MLKLLKRAFNLYSCKLNWFVCERITEKKKKFKFHPNALWSAATPSVLLYCLHWHLSGCVIKLVVSAGQSHQSLSNGQSHNALYTNCLLLHMLHQSEVIMTSVRRPVLLQRWRQRRGENGKTKRRRELEEHSRSLIQMTALNQRASYWFQPPGNACVIIIVVLF